jgi:hypothetical protein
LFEDTGKPHWAHADDHMRRAIKKTVIAAGCDPDLELPPNVRRLKRGHEQAEAKRQTASATAPGLR